MLLGGVAPFIICPKITNKLYIFMTRRPDSCRSWTHVNQSSTIDPTCASVWCQVWDKCVCVCAFCTYARSFSFITRRFRQPYLKKKSSLLTVLFFPFLSHRMTPQPRNYWHGSLSFDSLPRRLNWGSRKKKKEKKRDYLFIKPHRFTFITSILLVAAILRFLKKKKRNYEEWAGNAVEISFVSMGSVL